MRRLGVLVGMILAGGVWAASATASPAVDHVPMRPAATSVDHEPFCDIPEAPVHDAGAGGTAITFTILPRGC